MNAGIEDYEFLSSVMEQMHAAAAQGEWDHLVELEKKCSQRVAAIKSQDAATPLDEGIRQRKLELIRKILADDAEIRNLTEPWMGQLQRIMQSAQRERRLLKTYFLDEY